ncbi:uncharacterized protein STEHIDRAFT_35284, partial [Stereum hirsutum FP-91666 SS1]|uniref:uncharacterized protein n=1 Tax=Stereum hirsutum (strain FP-91666) TaxID=721885 RepID=UPI0004449BAD
PIFDPEHNEQQFQVVPAPLNTPLESICGLPDEEVGQTCRHELWLALDLDADAWSSYDKFTLRISWPASSPADFSIQTLTPRATTSHLDKTASVEASHDIDNSTTTRRQYARIRLVETGVRTPSLHPSHPATTSVPAAVPFVVTLEPLYLGVLPASVAPVLAFIVPLIFIASMLVSPIHLFLQRLATQARKEV